MSNARKTALVTGGSRGIGKAIVLDLAEQGLNVAFSYRSNQEAAKETAEAAQAFGVEVLPIQSDASSSEQAQGLVDQVHQHFGTLDALVNNAGITRDTLLVRMSDDDWHRVLHTNLSGPFYLCRAAAKIMMKQRSGSIVNISSLVGLYGNAGQGNYAASKAGLIGFTKSIAKELGARGVNVNVVAPGFIETDMTQDLSFRDLLLKSIPLRRVGEPEDVAKAVRFLVTSAPYITGQVLSVDGGLVL
jgi:3-oxoacyl-[acyl-carrier protein] reductase